MSIKPITYICIFLCSLFCSIKTQAENSEINIGIIASLSGPAEHDGRSWLEGAELAAHILNKNNSPVKLLVQDDQSQATSAISAFSFLAKQKKVPIIIGGTWDFLAETIFAQAAKHKTISISPTMPIETFSQEARKNPYAFTNALSMTAVEDALRTYLDEINKTSIASIFVNVPYGINHYQTLTSASKKTAILKFPINYESFSADIKSALLKAKTNKIEVIHVILNHEGLLQLFEEASRINYHPKFIAHMALDDAYNVNPKLPAFKNAVGIFPRLINKNFSATFKEKFIHEPKDYSAAGYDAVMFAAHAIRRNLKGSKNENFSYQGASCKLSFAHGQNLCDKTLAEIKAVTE